jgi:hypothetical protein
LFRFYLYFPFRSTFFATLFVLMAHSDSSFVVQPLAKLLLESWYFVKYSIHVMV